MAINIETKQDDKKEIEYPCLKKFINSERIVLFIKPRTGTCLTNINDDCGHFSESWSEKDAIPFKGEITLSSD